jgi:ABC-type phosphate transport system substrate-binding protein
MKKHFLLACAAVALLAAPASRLGAQGYVVIVNSSNPVSTMSKLQVADLVLKRMPKWKSGADAAPVDFGDAGVREEFSKAILGKSTSAVKAYWQQQLFAGKLVPPPEMAGARDVVNFVKSNPNAIGYVSKGAAADGVKIVTVE